LFFVCEKLIAERAFSTVSDESVVNAMFVSFTVELCEPVQVQTLELGNLELFSSLPQSFEVHISERFAHVHISTLHIHW